MKIDCKPRNSEKRRRAIDDSHIKTILWKQSLPFNLNTRGILVHRVRSGATFFRRGERSHDAVTYWCGNTGVGVGVSLTDSPPADRLLCARCESLAVAAGEATAEALAGRHVCVGVMKAFRLCCRNDQN